MSDSWLSYAHDRRCLHHSRLLRSSCSHYSDHHSSGTCTNAEHLHKPVDFADIGTRRIDDGYCDGVGLVAPEIPFTPEEDGDILVSGVRVDYLLVGPIWWTSAIDSREINRTDQY